MHAVFDIIDYIGVIGQGAGALVAIGLIFTGCLTIRSFSKSSW
jgi:hypothetical protein